MAIVKNRVFAVLAAATVLGASAAFVPAAQAYPPGTALNISASAASAKTSTSITFRVTGANAAKGSSIAPSSSNRCPVTFSATGLASKVVTASGGSASTTFSFTTTGIKTITATTTGTTISVTTGTGSRRVTTVYSCGRESSSTNVTIYALPVAPTVTTHTGGVGRATIAWTALTNSQAGGVSVSYYTATLYGPNSSTRVKFANQTAATSQTWIGLSRGTYYVAVTATTSYGTSPSSTKYSVTVT